MSLFGGHLITVPDSKIDAVRSLLAEAGHDLKTTALTFAQSLEHGLEQSDVGVFIQSEINTLKDSSLSSVEKFEAVVAKAVPFAMDFFAKGGVATVIGDVESAVRATVQGVFNSLFSTSVPHLFDEVKALLDIS